MPTPFTGGCACGAIRYTCSAEPFASLNCHCRDCQRASGSAFAAVLIVPVAAFSLTKGEPTYYDVKADSGNNMSRGFCGKCGAPVFIQHTRITPGPAVVVIQAASLDDPSWFQPIIDIYTSRAQPWDFMNPALQKFEKGSDRVLHDFRGFSENLI
jgi:hypothetical protein